MSPYRGLAGQRPGASLQWQNFPTRRWHNLCQLHGHPAAKWAFQTFQLISESHGHLSNTPRTASSTRASVERPLASVPARSITPLLLAPHHPEDFQALAVGVLRSGVQGSVKHGWVMSPIWASAPSPRSQTLWHRLVTVLKRQCIWESPGILWICKF